MKKFFLSSSLFVVERLFYLSGTRGMVDAFERVLQMMGVRSSQIIKDFFPGFV